MRKTLLCTGMLALALAVGCTKQRGSEREATASDTSTSQNQTQSDQTSANATAPANAAAMQDTSKLTADDRQFVAEAAMGGMTEVQLGQLAQEKGQSEAVKQLGRTLVNDHQQANQQLQSIAQAKQIDVSTSLDQQHQQKISQLQSKTGAAFDRAFLQEVVKDHTKDVAEFRTQSNKTQDAALRDFTSSTLPTLENHLQMAKQAQQQGSSGKSQSESQ
jgi:putative membrane protein